MKRHTGLLFCAQFIFLYCFAAAVSCKTGALCAPDRLFGGGPSPTVPRAPLPVFIYIYITSSICTHTLSIIHLTTPPFRSGPLLSSSIALSSPQTPVPPPRFLTLFAPLHSHLFPPPPPPSSPLHLRKNSRILKCNRKLNIYISCFFWKRSTSSICIRLYHNLPGLMLTPDDNLKRRLSRKKRSHVVAVI